MTQEEKEYLMMIKWEILTVLNSGPLTGSEEECELYDMVDKINKKLKGELDYDR